MLSEVQEDELEMMGTGHASLGNQDSPQKNNALNDKLKEL